MLWKLVPAIVSEIFINERSGFFNPKLAVKYELVQILVKSSYLCLIFAPSDHSSIPASEWRYLSILRWQDLVLSPHLKTVVEHALEFWNEIHLLNRMTPVFVVNSSTLHWHSRAWEHFRRKCGSFLAQHWTANVDSIQYQMIAQHLAISVYSLMKFGAFFSLLYQRY